MRAGLLNELIDVVRRTTATDKFGAVVETWADALTGLHASVSYNQSGFGVSQGEAVYTQVVTFRIRYNDGVQEYDRIRWQGRLYRLQAIDRYRHDGYMLLKCELITQD